VNAKQLEHLAYLRGGLEAGGQKKQQERRTVPGAVKLLLPAFGTIWQVGGGSCCGGGSGAAVHCTSDGYGGRGLFSIVYLG
jgi:hypothetical protein